MLVAGFDDAHPAFSSASPALVAVQKSGRLVAHTIAEAVSVLTRARYGAPSEDVLAFLAQFLEREPVGPSPGQYPGALSELAARGVGGASIYDGLVAFSAHAAGLRLLSLDRRAQRTYERVGVDFELIAGG